jgi:hypothetical protein
MKDQKKDKKPTLGEQVKFWQTKNDAYLKQDRGQKPFNARNVKRCLPTHRSSRSR